MTQRKTNQPPTALITGAARRIGRAITYALAANGWQVAIHHNASGDEAEKLAGEIRVAGGKAVTLQCDLSDIAAVGSLVDRCADLLGTPTCLINNASTFLDDSPADLRPEVWDRHLNTNLRAPVFLATSFARQLPQGTLGNIINVIDQRVLRPTPEFFSYTISKAALWTATRTLAQALAPNIRVNAVSPGPVLQSIHQSKEDFNKEVASTLLQRACPPEEIADAVLFILGSPSKTGQMITLDSGQHLA
jgi:NAD(P)-dependent dehydrogenase (short-subunit alcohol dehydrogenase family)